MLEKMCHLINLTASPFEKALIANLVIAYIQPFNDGNKRTSRMITNALLMSHDLYPFSYRSVDEVEHKKAVIIFYEKNNLAYFKQIFVEQFEFAVTHYFLA